MSTRMRNEVQEAGAGSWLILLNRGLIKKPQKDHRKDASECHRNVAKRYSERSQWIFPDREERESMMCVKNSQESPDNQIRETMANILKTLFSACVYIRFHLIARIYCTFN